MSRLLFALSLSCAALITGCNKSETSVDDGKPKAGVTVELLEAGQEPRQELRYRFQVGQNEKMVITSHNSMKMRGSQSLTMKVPTQVMTMDMKVEKITDAGNLEMTSELVKVEILETPGVPQAVTKNVRNETSKLVGMKGKVEQTDRGEVLTSDLTLPQTATPQLKQFMESLKSSMAQMSSPLPKEPVGLGAKWKVSMSLEMGTMKISQIATYTITELSDTEVKLDVTVKQSAPAQDFIPPGQTQSVHLESYTGSGEGKMVLVLKEIVPTSELKMETTNVISQGRTQVTTTANMTMTIEKQ